MPSDDGGYAFPVITPEGVYGTPGMSLRDYFAAKALQGLLSDGEYFPCKQDGETYEGAFARNAYQYADAMLKAREHHG